MPRASAQLLEPCRDLRRAAAALSGQGKSECPVEPGGHGLRVREHTPSEIYADRIRWHGYRRRPYLHASDDQRDEYGVNAQAPTSARLTGGQRRLKVLQCLFKLSSIFLERCCLFFDEMPRRVDAGLIDEKFRALPRAIYYFLGRIDGRNAFCVPHGGYLAGQVGGLPIAAYFSFDYGVGAAGYEIKGFARILSKDDVRLVITLVQTPSPILHSCAPG